MDLFSEGVDAILYFFNASEVSLLALICQLVKLFSLTQRQLVVPLGLKVLSYLPFAQVGKALLHLIEVLVFENLKRSQGLFRQATHIDLSLEF